jgi:hypothetical protein
LKSQIPQKFYQRELLSVDSTPVKGGNFNKIEAAAMICTKEFSERLLSFQLFEAYSIEIGCNWILFKKKFHSDWRVIVDLV